MLSDEMLAKVAEKATAWAAVENIPELVVRYVLEVAQQDLQSEQEVAAYCEKKLWSPSIVGWYQKFLDYLEQSKSNEGRDSVQLQEWDEVIRTAVRFRDALNLFLDKYSK